MKSRTQRRRNQKQRKTRRRRIRKQKGGSRLNAPNGSIVSVRLEKGDDYQPFVFMDKKDAEKEDL